MATTVVLKSVVKAQSGKVYVNFADGSQLEFNDLTAVQEWARQADVDRSLTQQLCVAYTLARSGDLSNVASTANKNFVFDLSVANSIRVQ